MLAITEAESSTVAAFLVFIAAMAGLYVQNRRGINAQRGDHAATAAKVDQLVAGATEARDDLREIKADLRDVKDEVRSHGDRLRSLEHMTITQDHTDRIVSENARKLQSIQNKETPHAS